MTTPAEFARQRALDVYRVLDSFPEAAYDDIVAIASALCDVPIALVSLIDRDRQWFKANKGFELSEGSRDESFCNQAIRAPDRLMEVPDARLDPRFADNPLVVYGPSIRFYAGMPLVAPDGSPIGTVCVLDRKPRALSPTQKEGLAALARLTMELLEARHRERELEIAGLLAPRAVPEPTAAPDAAPAVATAVPCTVAIFEVQDAAEAAHRSGERAFERALAQLEELLASALPTGHGDTANRVSGCADIVVLLHGKDTTDTLERLCSRLPAFEQETSLRVLYASAGSGRPDEPLYDVFERADTELTRVRIASRALAATDRPSEADVPR